MAGPFTKTGLVLIVAIVTALPAFASGPEPLPCLKGDLRCDQTVCDLFDVLDTIDQLMAKEPMSCEADVNCDGTVDLFDVVCQVQCAVAMPDHCLVTPCSGGSLEADCGCRNLLLAKEYVAADECYKNVLLGDPLDEEALFFRSATRLVRIFLSLENGPDEAVYTDSLKEMLEQIGIDTTGIDVLANVYPPPPTVLPDDAPTTEDFQEFVRTVIVSEIDGVIEDLSLLDLSFSLVVTQQELASLDPGTVGPVEIDFADSQILLAYSYALRGGLSTLYLPYDLDVDIDEAVKRDVVRAQQEVIDADPDLLTLRPDGSATLTLARQSLLGAAEAYFAASNFLRNLDDFDQSDDLFVIDPVDLFDDQILRTNLGEVWCSLNGLPLDFVDDLNIFCEPTGTPVVGQTQLDLSPFFLSPIDLRSLLPTIEFNPVCGDNFVDVTSPSATSPFPDPTFNGLLPGKTQEQLLTDFRGIGDACPSESFQFVPDQGSPGPDSVSMGANVDFGFLSLEVWVTDVSDVSGAFFDVVYDPDVIDYFWFEAGNLLEQGSASVSYLVDDSTPGVVTVAASRLEPGPGAEALGSVGLIRLLFSVDDAQLETLGSASLEFANSDLLDDQAPPQAIPGLTWIGGELEPFAPACNCCTAKAFFGSCDCSDCVNTVCAVDPFCCMTTWDAVCAAEAASLCSCCPGQTPGVCS